MDAIGKKMDEMKAAVDKFVDSQPKYVQPIFKGIAAAVPAMVFGVLIGKMNGTAVDLNKNNPAASENPMMKAQLQAMEQMGSTNPFRFSANIGTLMFTQTAVTEYSKLQRGTGDEDIWNPVVGSAVSGMAFSFVSALGTPAGPTIDAVLGTGVMFGAFNALFFKIGRAFGAGSQPAVKEEDFARTQHMLRSLGLERFEKNFKKGQLDDKCLLLLTDNVLAEIKIPPGPRLLILNATASYKTQMYNQHRGRADGAPPPGVLPPGMGMVQPSGKQGALQ